MTKKGPTYYVFYLIFAPDTWRLAIGVAAALWLGPMLFSPEMSPAARAVVCVMITAIGWAASGGAARWITRGLKRLVLGNRFSG
ncbi:MAG TPA: hypothetical protein ENF48_13085 [Desulfobacteraceae bacterium]|nr:hypothetical protein [Deltaproteobacteria bacterium]MBW2356042.1 hypothetical protein [Deltaproteobacteria bacterium]HDI61262.1 hypothetical protein [Desulfobacteraceae bacterium]